MKTKTVELYADLFPGWHESPPGQTYVYASSQPSPSEKGPNVLRVKITVELPEHKRAIPVDASVKGDVTLVP